MALDREAPAAGPAEAALIVDVDGFEGPLDVLLALSRDQKVDLRRISVLALAEQYLAFIARAEALRIDLAAEYLVMAAWLAYLKSRLLLPPEPGADGPSGAEEAARLAWQLACLSAMREAGAALMAGDLKGREVFARGAPEPVERIRHTRHTASLMDMVQAYARLRCRDAFRPVVMERGEVLSMEAALQRMRPLIGYAGSWTDLSAYLPEEWRGDPQRRRSATASTFAAALELVKAGQAELSQRDAFGPIALRRRAGALDDTGGPATTEDRADKELS